MKSQGTDHVFQKTENVVCPHAHSSSTSKSFAATDWPGLTQT